MDTRLRILKILAGEEFDRECIKCGYQGYYEEFEWHDITEDHISISYLACPKCSDGDIIYPFIYPLIRII